MWGILVLSCLLLIHQTDGRFLWIGAMTDTSVVLSSQDYAHYDLRVVEGNVVIYAAKIASDREKISITRLKPKTKYTYTLKHQDVETGASGSFETFPPEGQRASFSISVGSCSMVARDLPPLEVETYDRIATHNTSLFIQMGDMHYSDVDEDDIHQISANYDYSLSHPDAKKLFSTQATAYMWDDHDFGPNNADSTSPSMRASRYAYMRSVPHYPLVAATNFSNPDEPKSIDFEQNSQCLTNPEANSYYDCLGNTTDSNQWTGAGVGVYQAFTIGKVRVVMPDLRSESIISGQLMSSKQMRWLLDEIKNASRYSMMVLVSSVAYTGEEEEGGDAWAGHPAERVMVANAVAEHKVDNLLLVAGDAHMLAMDDGRNTDYNTVGGKAGIPVVQAAPLANIGSCKGGAILSRPFGYRFAVNNHFATLKIVDEGIRPACVRVQGWSVAEQDPLLDVEMCVPFVKKGKPGLGSCNIQLVKPDELSVFICFGLFFIVDHLWILLARGKSRRERCVWLSAIWLALFIQGVVSFFYYKYARMKIYVYIVFNASLFFIIFCSLATMQVYRALKTLPPVRKSMAVPSDASASLGSPKGEDAPLADPSSRSS